MKTHARAQGVFRSLALVSAVVVVLSWVLLRPVHAPQRTARPRLNTPVVMDRLNTAATAPTAAATTQEIAARRDGLKGW